MTIGNKNTLMAKVQNKMKLINLKKNLASLNISNGGRTTQIPSIKSVSPRSKYLEVIFDEQKPPCSNPFPKPAFSAQLPYTQAVSPSRTPFKLLK